MTDPSANPKSLTGLQQLTLLAENIEPVCRLAGISQITVYLNEKAGIVLKPEEAAKCREFAAALRKELSDDGIKTHS